MTPQDIKDKKFEKATFGGYDMSLVDDFLEQLYEDYGALYKENAILKSKLKVLVEKVEEYRSTEESMRMALLTAQKMAGEILAEARAKGETILAEVDEQAERRSMELRHKVVEEEARLVEAERKTSLFSERVLELIAEEKTFLERLKEFTIAAPAVNPDPVLFERPKMAPNPPMEEPEVPFVKAASSLEEEDLSLEKMESSVGAYLAQEVSRMTANSLEDEEEASPFVEDIRSRKSAFGKTVNPADEVDLLKMFDKDHAVTTPEKFGSQAWPTQPQDQRAEEKIDIARSISSALGDTEELKTTHDDFWDDEGEPTTKRPKFEFDNLQFGKNLHDDGRK